MRHCSIHNVDYFADCAECKADADADFASTPHPRAYYEMSEGAPNQHCNECRKHGICAYHRDWPHNMKIRR